MDLNEDKDDLDVWLTQKVRKQLVFVRCSVFLQRNSTKGLIQWGCEAVLCSIRSKADVDNDSADNDDDDDDDDDDNDDNHDNDNDDDDDEAANENDQHRLEQLFLTHQRKITCHLNRFRRY